MRMKVIALALVVCAASVMSSFATIGVLYQSNANTLYDHNSALLPGQQLFLAYWTPDTTISFNNEDPLSPLGNDVLIATTAADSNAGVAGHDTTAGFAVSGRILLNTHYYSAEDYGGGYVDDDFVGGYVYIAVFEYSFASYNGISIPAGTYYGLSGTFGTLNDKDTGGPLGTPDDFGAGELNGSPIYTTLQLVPEPSTIVLALLGIATIIYRRRK